jgi:hypothetical protein
MIDDGLCEPVSQKRIVEHSIDSGNIQVDLGNIKKPHLSGGICLTEHGGECGPLDQANTSVKEIHNTTHNHAAAK